MTLRVAPPALGVRQELRAGKASLDGLSSPSKSAETCGRVDAG